MAQRRVKLHIETLVLEGFETRDRARFAQSFEAELTRLLASEAAQGIESGNRQLATLDAGQFQVAPGSSPRQLGVQVAQAIFTGLKG